MQKKKGLQANIAISDAISRHYRDVQTKKPLAWMLLGPNPLIEIAYAAGIQPGFPENFAAVSASKHASARYCEIAEANGYMSDLCSYVRNLFGSMFSRDAELPLGGLGEPDLFLVSTLLACVYYTRWFDLLHVIFNKPLILVNTPRTRDEKVFPSYYVDYVGREIEEAITEIERVIKTKITEENLKKTVKLADEMIAYWQEIVELQKAIPCPANFPDTNNILFVLSCLSGTEEAVELMKMARDEIKEHIALKKGAIENEKHRLYLFNIPPWYKLRLASYFAERGCVFPVCDYTMHIWGTQRMDASNPIESLAKKALAVNKSLVVDNVVHEGMLNYIDTTLEDIKEYHIDGAVLLNNRSCKPLSVGMLDAATIIREKCNIPVLILDTDHTDERVYSDADTKLRIDAFLEMLG